MENRSKIAQMQMRRVVSNYQLGELLGSGSYSQVFKAKHLQKHQVFAIKVISNRILTENPKLAIHNVLQPCHNIVRFQQLLQTRNNCYFVYQYCEGGTLHQLIKKQKHLSEKKAWSIFNQLVDGLKVLRKHNIMHRDLKPENVLIKGQHFKIADFGFCKELSVESMTRTMLGSPLYMAPEVLRGEAYTTTADIWSIGVILYEMLYGCCPFESNSIASLINTIDDTYLTFDPSLAVSSNTKIFIMKCLQKDCRVRLNWEQLFIEVQKIGVKQYQFPIQINKNQTSNINLSKRTKTQLKSFSKQRQQSMLYDDNNPKGNSRVLTANQSKYEIFKQNYTKLQQNKSQNQVMLKTAQNIGIRPQRSKSINGKKAEVSLIEKQTSKQFKLAYKQMTSQHEACWNILQQILQLLQIKQVKVYPYVTLILKAIKKALQRIYSKINLNDTQMMPVLSIVKYQLIQIQKVNIEVDKVMKKQFSQDRVVGNMPKALKIAWNNFQSICCQ